MANAPGEVCARPGCGFERQYHHAGWHSFVKPSQIAEPWVHDGCEQPGCCPECPRYIPPVESRSAQGAECASDLYGARGCRYDEPSSPVADSPKPPALRAELAAYALKVRLEKLFAQALRSGVTVVVDSDAIAVRLIPTADITSGGDLRELGVTATAHNACGGGASAIGSHPSTHGGRP